MRHVRGGTAVAGAWCRLGWAAWYAGQLTRWGQPGWALPSSPPAAGWQCQPPLHPPAAYRQGNLLVLGGSYHVQPPQPPAAYRQGNLIVLGGPRGVTLRNSPAFTTARASAAAVPSSYSYELLLPPGAPTGQRLRLDVVSRSASGLSSAAFNATLRSSAAAAVPVNSALWCSVPVAA